MSLKSLYQQTIKKHSLQPTGRDLTFDAKFRADSYNPTCGDEIEVYFSLSGKNGSQRLDQIGFHADACAICIASASLLSEHAPGKDVETLHKDLQHLNRVLCNGETLNITELASLQGVSAFPSRINCALLPWQTLSKALETATKPEKSTE